VPSAVRWVNPHGGDWDNPANWSTGVVPGAGDSILINPNTDPTITHSSGQADAISSITDAFNRNQVHPFKLVLSGGSLSIGSTSVPFSPSSQIEIDSGGMLTGTGLVQLDNLLWDGGTMSGTGTTSVESTLTITGSALRTLDSRTLNNFGQATWSGTGNWNVGDGAKIVNETNATFSSASDAKMIFSGGTAPSFVNDAIFQKTAGTSETFIGIGFQDNDQILVDAATLELAGGGTKAASTTDSASAGAVLEFGGGTYTLETNDSINGAGTSDVSGGTLQIGQQAGDFVTVQNFEVDSGGTVMGPGSDSVQLFVAGSMLWTGGSLNAVDVEIQPGATLSINASTTIVTLENLALLRTDSHATGTWQSGLIQVLNESGIDNQGLFKDYSDNSLVGDGTDNQIGFKNEGAFDEFSQPFGTDIEGIALYDLGILIVESGATLNVDSGGANSIGPGSGPGGLVVDIGATLNFAGGDFLLINNTTLIGTGTADVSGGTLHIGVNAGDTVTAQTFQVDAGGTVAGPGGTVLQVNGSMLWTGGTLSGLGVDMMGGASLIINAKGAITLDDAGLNILPLAAGTWESGQIVRLRFADISNGGTFTDESEASFINGDGSSGAGFFNAGVFQEVGGTDIDVGFINEPGSVLVLAQGGILTLNADFTNNGAVSVIETGLLNIAGGGDNGISGPLGSFFVDPSSTLNFAGGIYTLVGGTQLTGAGTYDVTGGTLQAGQTFLDTVTAQNFEVDADGTVGGGQLHVLGQFLWTGGTVSVLETDIESGASLSLNGVTEAGVTLDGATLTIEEGGQRHLAGRRHYLKQLGHLQFRPLHRSGR
jgi:hypothetical protein